MEVSGQLHAPAALPPGKDPCYSLDRRLGGPQSRSGGGGEERNSQPPPGRERMRIKLYYLVNPNSTPFRMYLVRTGNQRKLITNEVEITSEL
jgi:hypothetical protein